MLWNCCEQTFKKYVAKNKLGKHEKGVEAYIFFLNSVYVWNHEMLK